MRTILVKESLGQAIFVDCRNKVAYENGKATDKLESTTIVLMSKDGEFQVVLPADEKECERFNNLYSFGDKVNVDELVDVKDVKVSVYKDGLLVKVLADYKEE